MQTTFRNGLNGLTPNALRFALATRRATKDAVRAEEHAIGAKIEECQTLARFLEECKKGHKATIEALDVQLTTIQEHMKASGVPAIDLGTACAPPSPRNETREILLRHLDMQRSTYPQQNSDESDESEGEESLEQSGSDEE
jgi:hypothetical protein